LGLKVGGAIRYYDWAVTSPWPFGRGLLTHMSLVVHTQVLQSAL